MSRSTPSRIAVACTFCLLGPLLGAGCRGARATRTEGPGARVYVSNEDGGTVSVIDAAADRVVATIPVGKRPRGLRLAPDGRTLYVALSGSPKAGPGQREPAAPPDRSADGIAVVDLAAGRVVRTLPSGPDPETFDLTPDGAALYVANEDSGEATAIDLRAGRRRAAVPVGGEPEGVAVRPDGKVVYVTSEAEGHVAVLEAGGGADRVIARIPTPPRPRAIAFTPDGARAFVTAELGAAVSVLDAQRHQVITVVPMPKEGAGPAGPRPMGVAVSPDGQEVYVTTGRGGTVVVLDATSGRVLRTIAGVGARPWGVAALGGKLYTANGPSNDVSVIDARTGALLRRIPAGASPWGVAASR